MTYNLDNWNKVFLDTSFILNLFKGLGDSTDPTGQFAARLINDLQNRTKGKKQVNREYIISSVTISEIWNRTSKTKAKTIVDALKSNNVTFAAFDNEIAEFMNGKYHDILSRTELNKFAKRLSWPENDLVLAREWLIKDVMLIATSEYYKCDVILSNDIYTMRELCKKLSVPGFVYAHPDCFNSNEKYVFTYESEKADKFVTNNVQFKAPTKNKNKQKRPDKGQVKA